MNAGKTLDDYSTYLPMTKEEMDIAGVPEDTQMRVQRLRTLYSHWVEFPNLSTKEMVEWEIRMERADGRAISKSNAYFDMQLVSNIIGNLQVANKEFMRWKVTQMLLEDRAAARRAGDFKSAVAADDKIAKYHQLDKPDTPELDFDKIVPVTFLLSESLEAAGLRANKHLRKEIKNLNKEMGRDIEDVDFEEVKDG